MFVKVLKSKLHHARVTDTKLHYAGSLSIDCELMKKAGILPYEAILVADLNNGNRFETYAVPAEPNSGQIIVLGAAAQLVKTRDVIIILAFGYCTPEEAAKAKPVVLVLDENNKVKQTM